MPKEPNEFWTAPNRQDIKGKPPSGSHGQTPGLIRCLSCFQLYPFIVVEVNIVINDLPGFFKGGRGELAESFFFEVGEEALHGCIVPTISTPRHGRRDVILMSKDKICLGSVLMSVVTVEQQSVSDLFFRVSLV